MESLPLDVRRKIALNLSPKELIELCLSSKEVFYKGICHDDEFWRLKVEHDYPEVMEYFNRNNLIMKNPKNTYIRVFSKISKLIEDEISNPGLYNLYMKTYNEVRKDMPYKDSEEFLNKMYELLVKNSNGLYKFNKSQFRKDTSNPYPLYEISLASPLFTVYGRKPFCFN